MALIETRHTLSRFDILKKDFIKTLTGTSCVSMLAFVGYYIYLAVKNLNNIFYLAIYSCLIVFIISLFLIDLFIKEEKKLLKNEQRKVLEKKRKSKKIIKTLKYIAKGILVGVAVYQTMTSFDVSISSIINLLTGIVLVVQILFEFIIAYIIKQIDCLELAFQLDIEKSFLPLKKFIYPTKKMEEKIIEGYENGESYYTPEQLKLVKEIENKANEYYEEKQQRINQIKNLYKRKH